MLASEAIKKIQLYIEEFGDLPLHIVDEDGFHFQEIERVDLSCETDEKNICIEIGSY